ncbi:peptide deformylase [Candidatus Saccharibacteria bacterium]|nr:peptide deformylase [Candidatus Saccharibacteria bacterium]
MCTKDDIITLPNSHLRQKSQRVGAITGETKKLIQNMIDATLDWEASRPYEIGAALAAVQIDQLQRAVIVRSDFDDKTSQEFTTLINPKVVKYEGEIIKDYEGCLSVKDVYGYVSRYSKVRVKALDLDGNEIRIKAEGFLARVLQHEIDHTNGKVFIDHIKEDPEAFFTLDEKGELTKLDYEKDIKTSSILWN